MSDTVFIGSANFILNVLEGQGIEPKSFIENTLGKEIDLSLRNDPNARIKYRDLEKVWRATFEQSSDECLGLKLADYWHPSHLGALGYAWLSSTTLQEAFSRLERYVHMITSRISIRSQTSDDRVSVVIERRDIQPNLYFLMDGMMAVIIKMCRLNAGESMSPQAIRFVHPEPGCIRQFEQYFGCPLKFNAADNRVDFAPAVLEKRLTGANPIIAEASDRIIIDYLSHIDDANVVDRVKAEIINQLPSGNMTDGSVASALHKSTRTMQRELGELDTTFSAILNEARHDLALKYIRDSRLTLTEIAFMLGFSESSSFSRAFKRWTGSTPSQKRTS